MSDAPNELEEASPEEKLLWRADQLACDFAKVCRELRSPDSPAGRDPAGLMMNTLMTELWDQGFSQTEIRKAFTEALQDMNRYAAAHERR